VQTAQARSYVKIIVIVSILFGAAVAASVLLPFAKVTYPKSENLYVIYYGHLVDASGAMTPQAGMILEANPSLVIVPHSFPNGEPNLTPELRQAFADRGIKVITYTWTNYSARPLGEVTAEIDSYISQSDGIFVDEVTNIESDAEFAYYSAIYNHVKENYGDEKLVIMNPGHYQVTEKIMQISDIASLEEEWVYHDSIPWKSQYPPSRFMGVSSNEYCGQCVFEDNAGARTADAWNSGIGYHFSTDRYIDLPSWFSAYISSVKSEKTEAPIQQ
jgi:hypothetical protein